jgi:natural product biosynthesis luciferase-like monooxygenase protein/amino acid adenylation domain-containing protein
MTALSTCLEHDTDQAIVTTVTFPQLLAMRAAEHPDRTLFSFVQDDDHGLEVSYRQLHAAAIRIATQVLARTHRGDRVLLLYAPGVDYIAAFFGCMLACVVAVPCYPPTNKRNSGRVDNILRSCAPSLILTSHGASAKLRRMLTFEHWLEAEADDDSHLHGDAVDMGAATPQPQDIAFLQYTSGSTASPKGVMVTHRNLIANSEQIRRALGLTPDSIGATWLPPYHDLGLIGGLLQIVYAGCKSFVLSPAYFLQQPARWLRIISSGRATHAGAPNFAYDLCVSRVTDEQKAQFDLSSWSVAFCGAEPIRAQTLDRFYQAFKSCGFRRESLAPCYGLAEATLLVAASGKEAGPVLGTLPGNPDVGAEGARSTLSVSSGRAVHGQVLAIINPETCARLPDGTIGEIWVAGENIAGGYWGQPEDGEDIAATFRAKIKDEADSPHFLRTGDLGMLRDGELYVAGRIKDVIILGGRNIYPQDVEAASCRSHPALRTDGAAAFAVNDDGTERLVVLQELDFRQKADDALFGHIASAIFDVTGVQPDVMVLVKAGSIPRTSSGKIRRIQSRMDFESGELQAAARRDRRQRSISDAVPATTVEDTRELGETQMSASAIEAWLKAQLADKLELDPHTIDGDHPFAYHGVNSLMAVELGGALGAWLRRPLAPTLFWDYPSPSQLARHLAGEAASGTVTHADSASANDLDPRDPLPISDESVAIIGIGCRFPGADDPEAFWQLISTATDAVRTVPAGRCGAQSFSDDPLAAPHTRIGGFLDQVDTFDPHFFGIAPREAMQIDPQQRLILEVAWEALENAAVAPADLAGSQTGVYVGISSHDYDQLHAGAGMDLYTATGAALSIAPNRLSYLLDLRGPSLAVDTACSSSLVAVHLACQGLRNGEVTLALAGGVNLMLSNRTSIPFATAGLLAGDGRCKAFDAGADGYGRGEGCGVVVLKRLRDALRDGDTVRAVIAGSAVNQDGRSNGLAAPNGKAQVAVIRQALAQAGVAPAQIGYIEAHGTGTALGDPIELNALKEVLLYERPSDRPCAIGSVKTNIGHLEAAAGVAGLIKTVLALERSTIPPNLHYRKLNPNCSLDGTPLTIPVTQQSWQSGDSPQGIRYGGISSFGFGGTIAHMILAQAPAQAARAVHSGWPCHLLTWSAKSTAALDSMSDRLAQALAAPDSASLADVACTLQLGRNTFNHRRMLVAADGAQAARLLAQRAGRPVHDALGATRPQSIVFMFPGQGEQRVRMAYQLYCHVASFRAQVDACIALLEPALQRDLRAALYPTTHAPGVTELDAERHLSQTALAQPALFIIEYALAQLWIEWGVQPRAMIGHSLGEYVAACVAGVFSLETALTLVCARARLMQTMPGGAMTSVALGPDRVSQYLDDGVAVAAVNAPERSVLAGSVPAIDALEQRLAAQGITYRRLRASHAFHSASMTPILDAYRQIVVAAVRKGPRIAFISNVTGTWITATQATDPDYWVRQLREPVRFSDGLATLASEPGRILIEVGPGWTLGGLTRQNGVCATMAILPTLNRGAAPDTDLQTLLETLGRVWLAGHPVNWSALHEGTGARRVALPSYPFDRQRCWIDRNKPAIMAGTSIDTFSSPMPPAVAAPPEPPRRERICAQLRGIVATLLQTTPDRIDPLTPLLELGADSLILVQAVRTIESSFGVTLTIRQLFEELPTISDISIYLDNQLPSTGGLPGAPPSQEHASADTGGARVANAAAPTRDLPLVPAASSAVPESPLVPPALAPSAAAVSGAMERIVAQQLQLMAQQLAVLGGNAPALPAQAALPTSSTIPVAGNSAAAPAHMAVPNLDPYRALDARQRAYLDDFINRFIERTRGSKALTEKYRPVLADYRAQAGFRFSAQDPLLPLSLKELFYPIVADRSEGARLWDVDGHEYVDLTMGFGAHLFGHNPSFIHEAMQQQIRQGIQLGPQSPLAGEVAELVQQLTGMERVAFCNSGTEAVMLAVRLARTATGRRKIALFSGSYHGWADGLLVGVDAERVEPGAAMALTHGLQPGVADNAIVLDYGAENALEIIRAHAGELAAVLVEPVQGRRPELQPRVFLQQLRALTRELGIALIFDEMITGFRLHPGGAQAWFDVRADLATYGKAVGGGMPLGIVAGAATYMNGVDGGSRRYTDTGQASAATTFFAGTFSKHPLAMATTRAVLQRLSREGNALQQQLNQRTTSLADRLNHLFAIEQLPMQIVQCGSLFRLNTLSNLDLFCYHLVAHGVYVWEGRNMYLSTAHSDADLDRIVNAFEASIRDLRQGGFLPPHSSGRTAEVQSAKAAVAPTVSPATTRPIQFSLSFFGNYDADYRTDKYGLLFDSARFADEHGFSALWLPERHFHAFGGLSPNPAVLCAALARETTRIQLRAGSVVLPLHHLVRVAEEWSMVDNLSGGRVGIALASGWHPNDFVLAPEAFGTHRERMFEQLRQVQTLWRGEALDLPDGSGTRIPVKLFPMPRQADLPIWITIVNNPDTYRRAGEIGAGVLTNLMGQTIEDLQRHIKLYRNTLAEHGHDPAKGRVTVLLHTFLDEDSERARATAREPFIRYLRSSLGLFQNMVKSLGLTADVASMTEDDRDYLLSVAYRRYVDSSALIGSAASCQHVVERLHQIGVDEIGCFIDFGVDAETVLASLPHLDALRRSSVSLQVARTEPPSAATIPLAFPQLRLWLVQQHFEGQQTAYNMPFALRLSGSLNVGALVAAFHALIARHETLRTSFQVLTGTDEPVQVIAKTARIEIPIVECQTADVERYATEHAEHVFDLTREPLLKVDLLRLSPVEHVMLLNMHEIISDGWSMAVMTRDIQQLYAAQLLGQADSLPKLSTQYSAYACLQRQLDLNPHRAYWRSTLAGYESALALPYDHARPATRTWRVGIKRHHFPAELAVLVVQFSRTHRVTPFMTVMLASLIVLHRYTGRADLCVGTTVAGRDMLQVEELIGFFINILPLRLNLAGDPTVQEMLERIRTAVLGAFEHQAMPFDQILSSLQLQRDYGQIPLVPVMVRFQNHRETSLSDWPGGLEVRRVPVNQRTAKCELDLEFFGKGRELGVVVEYAADLFEPATIERLLQHHRQVLEELVARPTRRLSEFTVLGDDERGLLEQWGTTAAAPIPDEGVSELFERRVSASPDAPACVTEHSTLSFAALNVQANRIAHALRARGVGAGVRVALYMERSPDFLAGLLAIFKVGGIYVPLDPHHPSLYVQRILAQVTPYVMVSTSALQERLDGIHAEDVLYADAQSVRVHPDRNPPVVRSPPGQLACITYTSGSTGQPMGVMVPHRQILTWLHALWARMPFADDDVVAQKTAATFSVSLKELLAGLLVGIPQVLIADPVIRDIPAFAAALQRWRVTRLNIVPSHWAALLDHLQTASVSLQSLRHCITAGEPLDQELADRTAALLPNLCLWNNYGCTELNDVTYCSVGSRHGPDGSIAMGKPITGTRLHVLDDELRRVPIGVAGELCVESAGIAHGYWARPGLTAERFVPNPFATVPGGRLFRTGDLVRRLGDGSLQYLGRKDFQIKIRGQRVDTLLVERELSGHPDIVSAAAMGYRAGDGLVQLVAYYTTAAQADLGVEPLRAYLAERLPSFMVPTLYVRLDTLPRLPSGKLDRRGLPAPEAQVLAQQPYAPPCTATERVLTAIWSELLAVPAEQIGVHDNFFALGGHSLLVTQMATRIQTLLSVKVTVLTVFEAATVARLAVALDQGQVGAVAAFPTLAPAIRTEKPPLSFAQQRMWFLVQLDPGNAYFNMFQAIPLQQAPDPDALRQALDAVIARHEILRTSFPADEHGMPYQRIAPTLRLPLPRIDLSELPEQERAARVRIWLEREKTELFDVAHGPLLRARLLKLGDTSHILSVALHHLIFDGLSINIFTSELLEHYRAFLQGRPALLPPLSIQYADYAVWQRACLQGAAFDQHLAYWKTHLEGAPALLELPTDRPRPAVQTYRGSVYGFPLSPKLTEDLNLFCRKNDCTIYVALLSGLFALLSRYSRQTDVVIGSMIADRSQPALMQAIGYFVNAVPLRVTLAPEHSALSVLLQVKRAVLGALTHQNMPFEYLVERLNPQRSSAYTPIYQVAFVSRDFQGEEAGEIDHESVPSDEMTAGDTTVHDLLVTARQTRSGIAMHLNYNTDLFDAGTMERLGKHFTRLMEAIVVNPEARMVYLPLMDDAERDQLLWRWNDTAVVRSTAETIQRQFEVQAAKTPDRIAVTFDSTTWSYADLNARANQLAHHLRGLGVGPDVMVGICIERSIEMVVGLLGILKAGAAYVPLDPMYPQSRLAHMLDDAKPAVVLTQQHLVANLPLHDIRTVCLDTQWAALARYPADNPESTVLADNLAYVIYTSGSTGRPKGTSIHQRGFVNLVSWFISEFNVDSSDRVLLFSSLSFDLTQKNIFSALLVGGQLHVPPEGYAPDKARLYIRDQAITFLNCAPSAFYPLMSGHSEPDFATLKQIFLGGEPIQSRLLHDTFSKSCSHPVIHNTYGPTEASDVVSFFSWDPKDAKDNIPIGRPIANTQIYILDPQLHPVPIGVAGQLHIAGDGLARGYLNRPDLTAEKFIPNPFGAAGTRMYRSGDLARFLPDGNIEYLGRLDHQVKIRGFRIELGEIEAAMTALPAVREAVVMARKDSPDQVRLVAYLVPLNSTTIDPSTLRGTLLQSLPEHMVPSHFVVLDRLPLTANGKLDRHALPAPDVAALALSTYMAPSTVTEHELAAIWSELLNIPVERVGTQDSFFALGGHSLLALHLQHALTTRLKKSMSLTAFFTAPTIVDMAAMLDMENAPRSLLVPLQSSGSGRPLFCIHPVGGDVMCYRALAEELGKYMPVHALQSPEAAGLTMTFDSVAAMAQAYAAAIVETQPEGIYRLLGWSSGGLIAMTVATALEKQGRTVEYVGLLDSHTVISLLGEPTEKSVLSAAILTVLTSLRPTSPLQDFLAELERMSNDDGIADFLFGREDVVLPSLERLTGATFRASRLESLRRQVETTRRHLSLLASYVPEKIQAPLHICCAKESHLASNTCSFHDETSTHSRMEQVDGDHYSILTEPHVHALAKAILRQCEALSRIDLADPARRDLARKAGIRSLWLKMSERSGHALHIRDSGEEGQTTCLLLHGIGDSGAVWDGVVPRLQGRYRVLSVDLRGHGESSWDLDGRYTVQDYLDDVLRAIDLLRLGRLILVGHSLGGEIALRIAAAHSERIARLVLVDFGPGRDRAAREAIETAVRNGIRNYRSIDDYARRVMERQPLTSPRTARHLAHASLRACLSGGFESKTDPRIVSMDLERTTDQEIWAMLKEVRCPTLVIRGNGSAILRDAVARKMVDALRKGEYQVVEAAGHSVITDNPQGCAAALYSFLCDDRKRTADHGSFAVEPSA